MCSVSFVSTPAPPNTPETLGIPTEAEMSGEEPTTLSFRSLIQTWLYPASTYNKVRGDERNPTLVPTDSLPFTSTPACTDSGAPGTFSETSLPRASKSYSANDPITHRGL